MQFLVKISDSVLARQYFVKADSFKQLMDWIDTNTKFRPKWDTHLEIKEVYYEEVNLKDN